MVADDLRRQCDDFLDLAHLMQKIGRDPSERTMRAAAGGAPGTPGNPGLERRYGIRQGDEPVES
jgi:hypothetical protein